VRASGCDSAKVRQKPRLLSDNGSPYMAAHLAGYLARKGIKHIRGAPMHSQTQCKIERWHQWYISETAMTDPAAPPSKARTLQPL
jgi:putative transposase